MVACVCVILAHKGQVESRCECVRVTQLLCSMSGCGRDVKVCIKATYSLPRGSEFSLGTCDADCRVVQAGSQEGACGGVNKGAIMSRIGASEKQVEWGGDGGLVENSGGVKGCMGERIVNDWKEG